MLQDVLLGLLKKSKGSRGRKTPLKVVVMSATLETEKLSSFYGHCPVYTIPGRTYPVKEKFCNLIGPKDKDSSVYVKEVRCDGTQFQNLKWALELYCKCSIGCEDGFRCALK